MSDQSGLVPMPNSYNGDEVRLAFLEAMGKSRLRTVVHYTSGPQTLTGTCDVVLADLTSGAFTVNLPASPIDGDEYEFTKIDGSGSALTIGRNSKNINGLGLDVTVASQWASKQLVWSATANTWWSRV